MKNEGHSRRHFLKKAALGTVGATAGFDLARRILNLWIVKAEHGQSALDLHEMLTLAGIVAQIIPTDETPGAREAGVVDYIDTNIKRSEVQRSAYHAGLQEVDTAAQNGFGKQFISLNENQQREVLKGLEKSEFFARVRRDIIGAFCRSKVGQRVIGYPGMAQPHGYQDTTVPPKEKRRLAPA